MAADLFDAIVPPSGATAAGHDHEHALQLAAQIGETQEVTANLTPDPETGIDLYVGQGGAPEGVLACAALKCVGGQFQGRLVFRNDDEKARAAKWGVEDLNRIYSLEELAKGDVIFAATGVTDGTLLEGVKRRKACITTESVVMRASTGTVRWVKGEHRRPPGEH